MGLLRPLNVYSALTGITPQEVLVIKEFSLWKFQIVNKKPQIKIDVVTASQGLLLAAMV